MVFQVQILEDREFSDREHLEKKKSALIFLRLDKVPESFQPQ